MLIPNVKGKNNETALTAQRALTPPKMLVKTDLKKLPLFTKATNIKTPKKTHKA